MQDLVVPAFYTLRHTYLPNDGSEAQPLMVHAFHHGHDLGRDTSATFKL
jgi:hypothetical protein